MLMFPSFIWFLGRKGKRQPFFFSSFLSLVMYIDVCFIKIKMLICNPYVNIIVVSTDKISIALTIRSLIKNRTFDHYNNYSEHHEMKDEE